MHHGLIYLGLPIVHPLLGDPALLSFLDFEAYEGTGYFIDSEGRVWTPHSLADVPIVSGKVGNAVSFIGKSTSHISTPYTADFDLQTFTLSLWLLTTSSRTSMNIVSREKTSAGKDYGWVLGMAFYSVERGIPYFRMYKGDGAPGTNVRLVGVTDLRDGLWHHILVTCASGGVANLYVDNVLEDSDSLGSAIGYTTDTPTLGAADWGGYWFIGSIDELYLFSKVLSAAERTLLFDV